MQYIKENGTKIFFMIGVFSFLAVSIPHVGAIFRMYEPIAPGLLDTMWNICSFAAAAGIDVLAGWLTLVMMNKEARGRDKVIIWTFIIALMVFSWYCNWVFDELHSPHPINVWAITIISLPWLGSWTVDQLTPLVVSALPVFIVAYASIAHLVGVKQNVTVISLVDLQQKAAEAQARAQAEVAIIKAQNMVNENKVTTAIDLGKTLWNRAINRGEKASEKDSRKEIQSNSETPQLPPPSFSIVQRNDEDESESEMGDLFPDSDPITDPNIALNNEALDMLKSFPMVASWLSAGRKTLTLKEIVDGSGRSAKTVRNRIAKRVIKPSGRNRDLYLIDSVIKWLKDEPNSKVSGERITVKLVANR